MKKQFKIEFNLGFISFDLIENDKTVGGYLVPNLGDNEKNMVVFLKKEGYIEYEEGDKRC